MTLFHSNVLLVAGSYEGRYRLTLCLGFVDLSVFHMISWELPKIIVQVRGEALSIWPLSLAVIVTLSMMCLELFLML